MHCAGQHLSLSSALCAFELSLHLQFAIMPAVRVPMVRATIQGPIHTVYIATSNCLHHWAIFLSLIAIILSFIWQILKLPFDQCLFVLLSIEAVRP